MSRLSGFARDQLPLSSEAVDNCLVADDPIRFIDAFVDGPNLAAGGARVAAQYATTCARLRVSLGLAWRA